MPFLYPECLKCLELKMTNMPSDIFWDDIIMNTFKSNRHLKCFHQVILNLDSVEV